MNHLVETHCHLSYEPLLGDLGGVLGRAREAGVGTILVPSYDLASWPVVARLGRHDMVRTAFGLHPWAAAESLDLDALRSMLRSNHAVAVGEIGLDSKVEGVAPEQQARVLTRQLELAAELGLPVILHCRGAFEELISLLQPFVPGLRGVVHAFSRGPELARRFVELGLYVAFGGAVTRPRARRARRAAQVVPAERLLLETDAPCIGLDGVAAEHVEPRHVATVAAALAGLRNETYEEVARITTRNAHELFGL